MTPTQFCNALDRLGLSISGAAQFLDYEPRTISYWKSGEWPVPRAVALLLDLMIRYNIKPEEMEK